LADVPNQSANDYIAHMDFGAGHDVTGLGGLRSNDPSADCFEQNILVNILSVYVDRLNCDEFSSSPENGPTNDNGRDGLVIQSFQKFAVSIPVGIAGTVSPKGDAPNEPHHENRRHNRDDSVLHSRRSFEMLAMRAKGEGRSLHEETNTLTIITTG